MTKKPVTVRHTCDAKCDTSEKRKNPLSIEREREREREKEEVSQCHTYIHIRMGVFSLRDMERYTYNLFSVCMSLLRFCDTYPKSRKSFRIKGLPGSFFWDRPVTLRKSLVRKDLRCDTSK